MMCLWWACGVCYHDNSKLLCIDLHQTGSVCAGSDHLQLIKFWRSCTPVKGVCGRAKILALPYYSHCGLCASMGVLRRARSACVSLSAFSLF